MREISLQLFGSLAILNVGRGAVPLDNLPATIA
jgi:hypothetical protein